MPRLYERPESSCWYAEILVEGKPRRVSTKITKGARNKKKAEEAAYCLQSELNEKQHGGITLENAIMKYLSYCELSKSTMYCYELHLTRFLAAYPDSNLGDVTPTILRSYMTVCQEQKVGNPSIRLAMAAIGSLMEMAIERGWPGAPEVNPHRLVSKKRIRPPVVKPRRWMPIQTVRDILAEAKEPFWKPFLTLILETGMRRGEALGLTWDEVDLKRGVIDLPAGRTKGGKARLVPLTSTAIRTLQGVERHPKSPHVFVSRRTGTRYRSVYDSWQQLAIRAGHPGIRIHDFRHTFASWTRQSGMSKDARKDIMGHSTEENQDLYAQTRIELLREELEAHSPSTLIAQQTLTGGFKSEGPSRKVA